MLSTTYTLYFTCIMDNLEDARHYFVNDIEKPRNFLLRTSDLNLKSICFPEPPSKRTFEKYVIWEPANAKGTTAFYSNKHDGLSSWIHNYARLNNKLCVRALLFFDKKSHSLPAYRFNYQIGDTVRTVYSMLDGDKWKFFEKGERLPFEKPEYYTKRKIRDRLPNELILSYLKELGWDAESPDFWRSEQPAHYFERIAWDNDLSEAKGTVTVQRI
jgi:hypothetical protein